MKDKLTCSFGTFRITPGNYLVPTKRNDPDTWTLFSANVQYKEKTYQVVFPIVKVGSAMWIDSSVAEVSVWSEKKTGGMTMKKVGNAKFVEVFNFVVPECFTNFREMVKNGDLS